MKEDGALSGRALSGEPATRGPLPPLHVLVPDAVASRPEFRDRVRRMQEAAGARLALHLRLREASGRRFHELARELRRGAGRHGGWLVVNGRVDVGLTSDAHAVQLGAGSLPPERVRELVGPEVAVGRSVHAPEEAREAARAGANYLVVGTVYATPSHPERPGAGPEILRACAGAGLPVVAIGGIDANRLAPVREAGAAGIAVIRAVWEAEDPVAAAGELLAAWRAASRG